MNTFNFKSRRSPVYGNKGAVATTQPLASQIGLSILQKGGNCCDAAVAVAAALNVTEPCSTGIGGDCFMIYFDAKRGIVHGLNGSGRAPRALSLEYLNSLGITDNNPWDHYSALTITVPGAAAGWVDTITKFGSGKLSLEEILQPAIQLAEQGYPVAPLTAKAWKAGEMQLKRGPYFNELLINGRAPRPGEVMKLPHLANTFKLLAKYGKPGFYEGQVAQNIVDIVQQMGGVLTLEDLKNHTSTFDVPLSVNYRGVDIYEMPPNGQGLTVLLALNILKGFELKNLRHNSAEHLHLVIEALRLAFADTTWYVTDPSVVHVPVQELLSSKYADTRRKLIHQQAAIKDISHGYPANCCDTVYFCVVDSEGSACSFINSNYEGFGTGLIPKNCGFTLQNRGYNFSLKPDHPNVVAPSKRPYHTIIPGMALKDNKLYCAFGVMGGFMQPQGHVQVLSNMIDFNMNPQEALDAPRFYILGGDSAGWIEFEEGIEIDDIMALKEKGHRVLVDVVSDWSLRGKFGRGQIIMWDPQNRTMCAGSDPRGDGQAVVW